MFNNTDIVGNIIVLCANVPDNNRYRYSNLVETSNRHTIDLNDYR